MQNSNVKFSSNIFPVTDGIASKDFVSKLTDYYRLRHLQKNFGPVLTLAQKKILEQTPYCALDHKYHDPCWGLSAEKQNPTVVCKCLKTDCQYFADCRATNPVTEEEVAQFAPRSMPSDLAEYISMLSRGNCAPIHHEQGSYKASPLLALPSKQDAAVPGWKVDIKTALVKESPFVQKDEQIAEDDIFPLVSITTGTIQENMSESTIPLTLEIPEIAPPDYSFLGITSASVAETSGKTLPKTEDILKQDEPIAPNRPNLENAQTLNTHSSTIVENDLVQPQIKRANKPEIDNIPLHEKKENKCISVEQETLFSRFSETEQETIIGADTSANIFVDAGPGTGKTYTLLHKLDNLVSEQDANPENIVVLCFTNAAVDEIKDRLRQFVKDGADRGLNSVDIRTFHSFAGWLISYANASLVEDGWKKTPLGMGDYNQSLITASQIIKRFTQILFSNWEHFIVDEVQDITNDLATFVLTIIDACMESGCGVTVLGDTCQAIYDYDQKCSGTPIKSDDFYAQVFERFADNGDFYSLSVNHRQSSELISLTKDLRSAILSKSDSKMRESTARMLAEVENLGLSSVKLSEEKLDEFRDGGKVCILLRSNAKTLKVSSDLRKLGIKHKLMADKTDYDFAPWISDIFMDFSKAFITRTEFELAYNDSQSDKKYTAKEVWERFQRALHVADNMLPVRELLNSIAKCKLDDPILRSSNDCGIIVSNIHRSKGREYDGVIIENDFAQKLSKQTKDGSGQPAEEYRVLYVAATRPKTRLAVSPLIDDNSLYLVRKVAPFRRYGRYEHKQVKFLEFVPSVDNPPETYAFIDSKIKDDVLEGDEVYLKRVISGTKVDYKIIHEPTGNTLGMLEPNIFTAIIRSIHGLNTAEGFTAENLIQMPAKIKDLYVSGIYSYIMDEDALNARPEIKKNAPNGVWKWIEITGVGHATYDAY